MSPIKKLVTEAFFESQTYISSQIFPSKFTRVKIIKNMCISIQVSHCIFHFNHILFYIKYKLSFLFSDRWRIKDNLKNPMHCYGKFQTNKGDVDICTKVTCGKQCYISFEIAINYKRSWTNSSNVSTKAQKYIIHISS